jgi:hypothetical protein
MDNTGDFYSLDPGSTPGKSANYWKYFYMNIRVCKHCKNEFDIADKPSGWMANHSRWCDENPKKSEYKKGSLKAIEAMNAARKKNGYHNHYTKAKLEGREIPESPMKGKPGTFLGKTHTEETKQILSEKALASSHRRLKKNTIEYKGILLDSSWELELAKRLDELKIKWVRPDPIPWVDEYGVTHNYFPDFYLEDYDLFLDPKNPQAVKVQMKKLNCLLTQYPNIIIIESLDECKQYKP